MQSQPVEIAGGMVRGVDAAWREDLERRIAVHEELGFSRNEATAAALREMKTEELARRQSGELRAAKRGRFVRLRNRFRSLTLSPPLFSEARAATLLSLPLFVLPWWADNSRFAWNLWSKWFPIRPVGDTLDATAVELIQKAADQQFYRFELFVLPLLAGLLVGFMARKNASKGVLNALMLLSVWALLLPGTVMGLATAGLIPDNLQLSWLPGPMPALCGIVFWAILGAGGAQIGQWVRGRVFKRRLDSRHKNRHGNRR